tara:strand:+ start:4322 stop:5098 length:777 start_codon:yes stop_codon:yes gene_type:complete
MDISVLLPSIRPNVYIDRIVDNLHKYDANCPYSYEILTTGPQDFTREDTTHFKNELDHSGIAGLNFLYTKSQGRYIVAATDDHIHQDKWWTFVDELEGERFKDRKYKILGIRTGDEGGCGMQQHFNPRYGDIPTSPVDWTARFPTFSRETIDNLLDGYLFNPSFRLSHCDIWLGHYLSKQNEPFMETVTTMMEPTHQRSAARYMYVDEAVCYKLMMLYESNIEMYHKYGHFCQLEYTELEYITKWYHEDPMNVLGMTQ